MIKAAFGQPGLLTNGIHGGGRIAAGQEQVFGGGQEPFFGGVRRHYRALNIPTSWYRQGQFAPESLLRLILLKNPCFRHLAEE
jgi:hypothetical protein